MAIITELKINTAEELHAYISSIPVMQTTQASSECPPSAALLNTQSATDILKSALYTYNYSSDYQLNQGELTSRQNTIREAIEQGADINAALLNDVYIRLEMLEYNKDILLTQTSASSFLKSALQANIARYGGASKQYESDPEKIKIQSELIKTALDRGAKLFNDQVTIETLSHFTSPASLFYNKELLLEHPTNPLLPETLMQIILLKYCNNNHLREDNEVIRLKNEVIKYAIKKGADLSNKILSEDEDFTLTLFEQLFTTNRFAIIDLAREINPHANYTLSISAWLNAINKNSNISFIVNALQRFPEGFSKEEAHDFLRAQGASHSSINGIFDIYDLAKEVIKATADQQSATLSNVELQILDTHKNISLADCTNGQYQNSFGFSPLSFALLAGKFELAIEMIENGFSLTEKNNNGVTPIQILAQLFDAEQISSTLQALMAVTLEKLDNIDVLLNEEGESLVDNFLGDQNLKDAVLAKTNDPLFAFYKPNADLFIPSLHPEQIHIAISMGEGFWSTGLNAVSRLISKEHPEVKFYLVTLEMMEKGSDAFINQFNGWINPGAGDSFPKDKAEFNKNDWEQSMVLEQAYQKALGKTHELKIPYIGMCAGAQNFALYHDGHLHPLKDYNGGNHTMYFKPATLSHFMAMTKEQQKHALHSCEFPEIAFKGDTAHHYAAVANKLGSGLQLGAVSEDGIAMAYAHENGLRYATQFHPEHYYHLPYNKHGGINHQKVWLENFIHLTRLHHKHIKQGYDHPEIIFDYVSDRLEECIKAPICLVEQNIFSNSTIAQALFE